ncbi:MAG TPA: hypothetical protein EYH31_04150, partial [Anaerolineae bacterium]|nr:hypothetical protein [Anaerolineae bacterium]
MKPVYDVLVIARRLFCDLVFIGLPNPPRPGQEVFAQGMHASAGGAFNVAAALQRLGLRVGLVTDIGDDFFSRFVCEQLASERLDDSLVRWHKEPLATVTVALPWNGDRAFVSYVESKAFPPFGPELLDHCQARHLHCSGLEEAIVELELLRAAQARGMTISIDCQWHPQLMEQSSCYEV